MTAAGRHRMGNTKSNDNRNVNVCVCVCLQKGRRRERESQMKTDDPVVDTHRTCVSHGRMLGHRGREDEKGREIKQGERDRGIDCACMTVGGSREQGSISNTHRETDRQQQWWGPEHVRSLSLFLLLQLWLLPGTGQALTLSCLVPSRVCVCRCTWVPVPNNCPAIVLVYMSISCAFFSRLSDTTVHPCVS